MMVIAWGHKWGRRAGGVTGRGGGGGVGRGGEGRGGGNKGSREKGQLNDRKRLWCNL